MIDLDALEEYASYVFNENEDRNWESPHRNCAVVSEELLELIARLRAAEKDAERYQFWRREAMHKPAAMAKVLSYYETTEQLDAAIDSAIDQQRKIASGEGV